MYLLMVKEIVTLDDYKREVEDSENISVIDFWAPWCMPCKAFAPAFQAVSEEYDDKKKKKVNVDEAQDLGSKFNIMSIPTILVVKGSDVVDMAKGNISPDDLRSLIDKNK